MQGKKIPTKNFDVGDDLKYHITEIIRMKLGLPILNTPGVVDAVHANVKQGLLNDGAETVESISMDNLYNLDTTDMVSAKLFGDEVVLYKTPEDPPEVTANSIEVTTTSMHALVFIPESGQIRTFGYNRERDPKTGELLRIPFRVTMKGTNPEAFMSYAEYDAFTNPVDPMYVNFMKELFDINRNGDLILVFKVQRIRHRKTTRTKKFLVLPSTKIEGTKPYSVVHVVHGIPEQYEREAKFQETIAAEVAEKVQSGMDPQSAINEVLKAHQDANVSGVLVTPNGEPAFVGNLPPKSEIDRIIMECPYPPFIKERIRQAYEREENYERKETEREMNKVLHRNNMKMKKVKEFKDKVNEAAVENGIDKKCIVDAIHEIDTLTKNPSVMNSLVGLKLIVDTNFSEVPSDIHDVISKGYNRIVTEFQAFSGESEVKNDVNIEKAITTEGEELKENSITDFLRGEEHPTFQCVILECTNKDDGAIEYVIHFNLFSDKIVCFNKKEIEV